MKQINTTRFKFQQTNLSCIEKVFLANVKENLYLKIERIRKRYKEFMKETYKTRVQSLFMLFFFFSPNDSP